MTADLINSGFEFTGTVAVALSAYSCWKNKSAAGVHWFSAIFFFVWGWWNLYYYSSLDQTASFIAGLMMVVTQMVYMLLVIKYTFLKKVVDNMKQLS